MGKKMINGRQLLKRGWKQGPAVGMGITLGRKWLQAGQSRKEVLNQLDAIYADPSAYLESEETQTLAQHLLKQRQPVEKVPLREEPAPLTVWGETLIDPASTKQIEAAALLPPTVRVALMPDAHIGYGLPIGGVAALEGAIAPYMVGVDIGCRMHATIFDRNPIHLQQDGKLYEELLWEETFFGREAPPKKARNQHPILDDPRWDALPRHLRNLKNLAAEQLGTSGGGNHFVEWTKLSITAVNQLNIPEGKYIALVSHSGSRGVGYKLANYYSKIAQDLCAFLPKEMRNLGYLTTQSGDAEEYELAMTLAGDFARANHEVIHQRITSALGGQTLGTLQNHHNYAWRVGQGEKQPPVYIHRKGATPAAKGVLGIIPGSMATPGFFVEGACAPEAEILTHPSLNSASHGSGRVLGRRQAINKLDARSVRSQLRQRGVTLLGGGLDEAPDAYKDSRQVLAAQEDLVTVWAEFLPAIVRMAADKGKSLGRK